MATGVTPEKKERIQALLAEGKTTNAIAKETGLSWRKVKDVIIDMDEVVEKGSAGRNPKYSDDHISELVEKFREYIRETELPIIAEFAYQNEIDKTLIYDKDEFSTLRKIAIAKKEARLERGTLIGEYNPTMAVFSLKQLGWTDKQQVEATNHNMNTDVTNMTPEERRARIDELIRKRGT
ncbi:hypothetical protein RW092_00045 [Paenibacillus sp. 3LSP]|uniref:hypothetical protein n=1 Tax=Paenibacillus sp. 3LSP TaxID=2800795 RepID=UPI0028FD5D82|nr:hypothetical protein [Paenibacillus sp. 3LSP]MDU0328594.1 hypothetical protein [Paenibacillus sp. 3LSP]